MAVEKKNSVWDKVSTKFVEKAEERYTDKVIEKCIDKCFSLFDILIEFIKVSMKAKKVEIRLNEAKISQIDPKNVEKPKGNIIHLHQNAE